MCGIIGYIGKQRALPILLEGLKNMEYRGYDSAGVAVSDGKEIFSEKAVGKILNLEEKIGSRKIEGFSGIGHTRWATHGGVTEENAHPHSDCYGSILVVHNGIVENYKELKTELSKKGHRFLSQTDTEILAHLMEEEAKTKPLEDAVSSALKKVRGTYGLAVLSKAEPGKIIAARNFSPLLLGIGQNEYFIASDASAILKHTAKVIYLDDGEIAVMAREGHNVYDLGLRPLVKKEEELDWSPEKAQKNDFPHFMLKEIHEGPEAVLNSIRGRVVAAEGRAAHCGPSPR